MAQQKKQIYFVNYMLLFKKHIWIHRSCFQWQLIGVLQCLEKTKDYKDSLNKWRVEDNLSRVAWYHCILHQKSLVIKSLKIPHVTKVVKTTINWIRANAIYYVRFKKYVSNIDAYYNDVAMFTAVRWLSRAACLKKFYELHPEIKMFAERKKTPLSLAMKHK